VWYGAREGVRTALVAAAGAAMPARVGGDVAESERRRAEVQWLRVIGMLLVFMIHVAEPFNPWDAWHIVSPERSKWLGEVVFLLAPWIMPLFMILAGESAWYALERRSPREYVRERLLRIGLPLVAGILLLVPPQVWLERRLEGRFQGSLLAFYPHFFDGIYPRGNLSWHHLWFLVFLVVFAIVTLLFEWLRAPRGRAAMARIGALCEGRAGIVWFLLPAVSIRVGSGVLFARVPSLAYDWSNRTLLLPAFVAGFVAAGERGVQRAIDRHWVAALTLAFAISGALCAWAFPGNVLDRLPAPWSGEGVLLGTAYGCAAGAWILALLGFARRHHARRSAALDRASELAYPFYVLHHGVIIAFAFLVVQWQASIAVRLTVLAGASLVATLALCTTIGWIGPVRILFGLRARPRPRVGQP
jgi:glucan biosynthesis protein C